MHQWMGALPAFMVQHMRRLWLRCAGMAIEVKTALSFFSFTAYLGLGSTTMASIGRSTSKA